MKVRKFPRSRRAKIDYRLRDFLANCMSDQAGKGKGTRNNLRTIKSGEKVLIELRYAAKAAKAIRQQHYRIEFSKSHIAVAERAKPLRIKRGTMLVHCASPR